MSVTISHCAPSASATTACNSPVPSCRSRSASPTALLSELAVKYFAETGLFKRVYLYPAPVHADYTLRGRVLDFAELAYQKGGTGKAGMARAGLNLDLVRTRDNEVVWSARKEVEVPIQNTGMRGVVTALNAASQE